MVEIKKAEKKKERVKRKKDSPRDLHDSIKHTDIWSKRKKIKERV